MLTLSLTILQFTTYDVSPLHKWEIRRVSIRYKGAQAFAAVPLWVVGMITKRIILQFVQEPLPQRELLLQQVPHSLQRVPLLLRQEHSPQQR